jgi:hypothetical protein
VSWLVELLLNVKSETYEEHSLTHSLTHLSTQWAAVTAQSGLMIEAPQSCEEKYSRES